MPRRRSRWLVRLALGAIALALMAQDDSSCSSDTGGGGDSAEERRQARGEERRQEREIDARVCADNFSALQEALEELNSRLSVGLSYDEDTTKLGDVRVEYDQTDFAAGGGLRCLQRVGVKLEGAMNNYARAAKKWNDCITDYACENDSIQPDLQARWEKAGELIERAGAESP